MKGQASNGTKTASRCTFYLNVTLLCAIAALLLSHERDILSIFATGGLLSRNSLLDDDEMNLHKAYHLLPNDEVPPLPGRFPRLGSLEFKKQCSWTAMPANANKNCTVYMTPRPKSHEGLSYWLSETIMSYMEARMGHCQFYLDYGKGVEIHDVFIPASEFVSEPQHMLSPLLNNWRVPTDFVCRENDKCITDRFPDTSVPPSSKYDDPPAMFRQQGTAIGPIPRYRFAFQYETWRLYRDDYNQTAALLPGWNLETGAACSLGNLFHLSPTTSKYDNDGRLLTEILPMVRQNPTFAIYIRTGRAEHYNTTSQEYEDKLARTRAESIKASVATALELETQYLRGELDLGYKGMPAKPLPINEIENIVWLVITDDHEVRTKFLADYDEKIVRLRKGGRKLPAKITGKITRSGGQTVRVSYIRKPDDRTPPTQKPPPPPKIKTHVGGTVVDKAEKTVEEKIEESEAAGITRRILVTSARGTHTRPEGGGVSTADFAEAAIDWYLLGESDAVIASKLYSFGVMGAFRTARPIYDPNEYQQSGKLKPLKMVWEGSPALDENMLQKKFLAAMDKICLGHPGFKGEVGMLGRKYNVDCNSGKQRKRVLR